MRAYLMRHSPIASKIDKNLIAIYKNVCVPILYITIHNRYEKWPECPWISWSKFWFICSSFRCNSLEPKSSSIRDKQYYL